MSVGAALSRLSRLALESVGNIWSIGRCPRSKPKLSDHQHSPKQSNAEPKDSRARVILSMIRLGHSLGAALSQVTEVATATESSAKRNSEAAFDVVPACVLVLAF